MGTANKINNNLICNILKVGFYLNTNWPYHVTLCHVVQVPSTGITRLGNTDGLCPQSIQTILANNVLDEELGKHMLVVR